jgi:hypothetical protein
MKATIKLFFVIAFMQLGFAASAKDYYAADFGAKADGKTMNTKTIQAAIDYISEHGGGRLIFSPGSYVSGTIYLKSDVTLHLEGGSTLLGSINPWEYDKHPSVNWESFIWSVGQKNIGITGSGTIDGQGFKVATTKLDFYKRGVTNFPMDPQTNSAALKIMRLDRLNEDQRPVNLYFRECENVYVDGITLRDPACWNQIYDQCKNVKIYNITVDAKAYWNNDGIDIIDCDSVHIKGCNVDAADDVFCFKSHSADHICQNVLIEDCIGRSSANGVKFGTVSKGGFKNFEIRNITIFNTARSAITFAAVDGGICENIHVDGVRSYNTGNVIFLRTDLRWHREGMISSMNNITIKNVYAEIPAGKGDAGYSYECPIEDLPRNISPAIIIYGQPDMIIDNVSLENIEITSPGAGNPHYAYRGTTPEELDAIPDMRATYPEYSMQKELPSWGFYTRHASNISVKNMILHADKKDYRPAVLFHDVNKISFENIKFDEPESEGKKQVISHKAKSALYDNQPVK